MSIMLVIIAVGDLFSLSRAGIGSCLCSMVLFVYLVNRSEQKMKITSIMLIFLLIIITVGYWIGYYPIVERFKLIPNEWESRTGRWAVWQDSVRIIKDFPVTGAGLANFGTIFVHYKRFTDTHYTYAHNDFVQFLVEMGVAGFILLILTIYLFYRQALLYPWPDNSRTRMLVLGMLAGIFAVVAHSFFDFPLQIPANTCLLAVYAGLLFACIKIDSAERLAKLNTKHIREAKAS